MGANLMKIAAGLFVLFALYQLLAHPNAVTSELKPTLAFVLDESKVLEGR